MRNKLDDVLLAIRDQGRCAFIPYLMGGDPNPDDALTLMRVVVEHGADVLEIGFPHSDPIADGPTIQAAAVRALTASTTTDRVLELAGRLAQETDTPLVAMAYTNPIVQYGPARFAKAAAAAGFAGVIAPDLPFEERQWLEGDLNAGGLHLIPLVAPTTPRARLLQILNAVQGGFVYAVSVTGVTGARATVDPGARELLQTIADLSSLPRALGFGIRDGQSARRFRDLADAVVVGSALLDCHRGQIDEESCRALGALCEDIVSSLK